MISIAYIYISIEITFSYICKKFHTSEFHSDLLRYELYIADCSGIGFRMRVAVIQKKQGINHSIYHIQKSLQRPLFFSVTTQHTQKPTLRQSIAPNMSIGSIIQVSQEKILLSRVQHRSIESQREQPQSMFLTNFCTQVINKTLPVGEIQDADCPRIGRIPWIDLVSSNISM